MANEERPATTRRLDLIAARRLNTVLGIGSAWMMRFEMMAARGDGGMEVRWEITDDVLGGDVSLRAPGVIGWLRPNLLYWLGFAATAPIAIWLLSSGRLFASEPQASTMLWALASIVPTMVSMLTYPAVQMHRMLLEMRATHQRGEALDSGIPGLDIVHVE